MYISLKEGWKPLIDLCSKYDKDKSNMNRVLEKINNLDKEKVGNVWIVKESEFVKYIKTDIDYKKDDIEKINEIIDKFTTELAPKLTLNLVKNKFCAKNILDGEYILKTFLEWAIKCQINFPIEIYKHIEKEELYTKCLLVQSIWNKVLKYNK